MKVKTVKDEIVWDWFRSELAVVGPEESVEEAAGKMRRFEIHHLLVMDKGRLVGMLDARDFIRTDLMDKRVLDLMRSDVPVVDENMGVYTAVQIMVTRRLTALPFSHQGKVSGILTETDILRFMVEKFKLGQNIPLVFEKIKTFLAEPLLRQLHELLNDIGA